MSIKINVLGTGSLGNCTYIECDGTGILIDCGFTYTELCRRLKKIKKTISNIELVFISHQHPDHNKAAKQIKKKQPFIKIYSPEPVGEEITVDSNTEFSLGNGRFVTPFPVQHDLDVPCYGYLIEDRMGNKYAHVTDFQTMTCESLKYLIGVHGLFLECNFDDNLLDKNKKYGEDLKLRVLETHFSNEQAKDLIELIAHPGLEFVICGHLSASNNHPIIAETAVRHGLELAGCYDSKTKNGTCDIVISEQDKNSEWLAIL